MGFTRQQAEAAIKIYGTVSAALDSLLAGVGEYTEMQYYKKTHKKSCNCPKIWTMGFTIE